MQDVVVLPIIEDDGFASSIARQLGVASPYRNVNLIPHDNGEFCSQFVMNDASHHINV